MIENNPPSTTSCAAGTGAIGCRSQELVTYGSTAIAHSAAILEDTGTSANAPRARQAGLHRDIVTSGYLPIIPKPNDQPVIADLR